MNGKGAENAWRTRSTMSRRAKPAISFSRCRKPLIPGASRSMSSTKTCLPLPASANARFRTAMLRPTPPLKL